MQKIILSILFVLSILLISGCICCITTKTTEQIPDPIIGSWHRQSYSGIPIIADIQQADFAPIDFTINSDGTCTGGSWKWVDNNSYELYSNSPFIPNGTLKMENGKMYLSRWSIIPPDIFSATYTT